MASTTIDLTEINDENIFEIAEKHADKKITGDWLTGDCEIRNFVNKRCNQAFIAGIMFAMENITTEVDGVNVSTTLLTDVEGNDWTDMVFKNNSILLQEEEEF